MSINDGKRKCENDLACARFMFKGSYKTLKRDMQMYRVINLRMPKSKPLFSHYLLSEHVFTLGAFNQFRAYILIFEIGFLKFQNLIFGPKW